MTDVKDREKAVSISKDIYPEYSALCNKLRDSDVPFVLQLDVLAEGSTFSWRSGTESIYNSQQLTVDEMSDGSLRAIVTSNETYPIDAFAHPENASIIKRNISVTTVDADTNPFNKLELK